MATRHDDDLLPATRSARLTAFEHRRTRQAGRTRHRAVPPGRSVALPRDLDPWSAVSSLADGSFEFSVGSIVVDRRGGRDHRQPVPVAVRGDVRSELLKETVQPLMHSNIVNDGGLIVCEPPHTTREWRDRRRCLPGDEAGEWGHGTRQRAGQSWNGAPRVPRAWCRRRALAWCRDGAFTCGGRGGCRRAICARGSDAARGSAVSARFTLLAVV